MRVKSTRQRILEILSNQELASAAELSRALNVTRANVRYHLKNMESEGLVIAQDPKQSGRRGRPARRFSLASKALKDNYDILSVALLEAMIERTLEHELELLLRRVAENISAGFKSRGPLGSRLVQAVDQLNAKHYHARWEAHADSPQVIFEHCPFASLRPKYPILCQVDKNLLEYILDESVKQIATEAYLPEGSCLFSISRKLRQGDSV